MATRCDPTASASHDNPYEPLKISDSLRHTVGTFVIVNSIGDTCLAFRGTLLRELIARGHRVVLSTPLPEQVSHESIESSVRALGGEVVFAPFARTSVNPFGELAARRHYRELFSRLVPDGVFVSNPKPVFHALGAARACGTPRRVAMITGLGHAFIARSPRALLLRAVAYALYFRAMRSATSVFFQNHDDLALFRRRALLPSTLDVRIVGGSGVDLARFPTVSPPEGPPVFLMVARLLTDKGVREFAEAARIVKLRLPMCRFRLVGWIDSNPAAIDSRELDGWVRNGTIEFAGRVDDVRAELAGSSVFVLPSHREGMPKSTLEALATGRPIITTDAPGCRETVITAEHATTAVAENGLLVPIRDAESLAAACLTLATDAPRRASMGRASRILAETRFDSREVDRAIVEALGA